MHLAWMHSRTAYLGLGITGWQDELLRGLGPLSPTPHWVWSCREATQGKSPGESHLHVSGKTTNPDNQQ